MNRGLAEEHLLWLLGSLSTLYRIPFDATLVAQQYLSAGGKGMIELQDVAFRYSEQHPRLYRNLQVDDVIVMGEHGVRMGVVTAQPAIKELDAAGRGEK